MKLIFSLFILWSLAGFAAVSPKNETNSTLNEELSADQKVLLLRFGQEYRNKTELKKLKEETLGHYGRAVPVLIEVMKGEKFPEKSRWMATFLLGEIVGEKSAPYIAKFVKHPNWMMRLASLKTLLALNQKGYNSLYREALKDKSLLVRSQALDNISRLKLLGEAPHVWSMLLDSDNYYKQGSAFKRSDLIKKVVRSIGDLRYHGAKKGLYKMIKKDNYKDIYPEITYALTSITGKVAPKGGMVKERDFWIKQLATENL